MIRPPKDLLATKGLYDTEDWTRIAGDVGAILLQCKTEEELLEAAHVLSTVQIASMPPKRARFFVTCEQLTRKRQDLVAALTRWDLL